MLPRLHRFAALVATLCIALFFTSTLVVELVGTTESIVRIKSLILSPGLWILIPAIAVTGITGAIMGQNSHNTFVVRKKKRMPFIALNGVVILIPAAYFLDHWASLGEFNATFYLVQGIELLAGAVNLTLMAMNMRDGLKLRTMHSKRQRESC